MVWSILVVSLLQNKKEYVKGQKKMQGFSAIIVIDRGNSTAS